MPHTGRFKEDAKQPQKIENADLENDGPNSDGQSSFHRLTTSG